MSTAIYLTFDDGPREETTPRILDALAARDARATFFQEGRWVVRSPRLTKRVVSEGHGVGNHAWSHPRLGTVDGVRLEAELVATSDVIARATGAAPTLFRPPYGHLGESAASRRRIIEAASELGMETVLWDYDAADWTLPGVGEVVESVVSQARPGAIVLLHDSHRDTAAAVPLLLDRLAGLGYRFEALPAGLGVRPDVS